MSSPLQGSDAWKGQDKGPSIVIVCWTMTTLGTIFVIARLYVRGMIWQKLQADDYYVTAALICGYVSTALSTLAVKYGNGMHFSLLTTDQQEKTILFTIAGFLPGVLSFGLPKMAVVSLLTRLLNPSRKHQRFLWAMGIWCMLTLFATCGMLIGQCYPANSLWDFSVEGSCIPKSVLVAYCQYAGVYSAFVDFYLAVYPTVVLYKLQLNIKKKLALCCALGIGCVSAVVAVYKTTRISSLSSSDFSYDTSDLVIWTVTEGNTIIIACSIPILQPLLDRILKCNPFDSKNGRSSKATGDRYSQPIDMVTFGGSGYKKVRDAPGMAVAGDGESQEVILPSNGNTNGRTTSTGKNVVSISSPPHTHGNQDYHESIRRTLDYQVSFEGLPEGHLPRK